MAQDPRAGREAATRRRADGVTIAPAQGSRKTLLLLAGAAALAAFALLVLMGPPSGAPAPPPADAPPDPRVVVRLDASPHAQARPLHARRKQKPAPPQPTTPQDDAAPQPAEEPEPGGEPLPPTPTGIALFPPPGTVPVKIGIVVPEDFELPEGYVRHYQVTDDGQELPAILMFHPDYDWVDETGQHVEVSEDGVVPPELAPEGLPIEMLELPEAPSEP